jgi:hypothetical protein
MFYGIVAAQLLLLVVITLFAVRWFRSQSVERRASLLPGKRFVFLIVTACLLAGALVFAGFGITGIRVTGAVKEHLRAQFGESSTWEITLSKHVVTSEEPRAGNYRVRYRYGEREGDLVAEYTERDGKLQIAILPYEEEERTPPPCNAGNRPPADNSPASKTPSPRDPRSSEDPPSP